MIGILISVLFIVIIILFAVTVTIYFVKNQHKKEIKIRQTLAKDLHDDLGSCLTNTRMHAYLAEKENTTNEHFLQIKESVDISISKLKDVVWILDDDKNSVLDFYIKIKNLYNSLQQDFGIKTYFEIDESLNEMSFSKDEKKNLLMITKEAFNNALKYAQCNSIHFIIQKKVNKINISIKDDGTGFDLNNNNTSSYGLKNMESRAKEINYLFQIISSKNGTEIILQKI